MKRTITLLLALAMCIGLLPVSAFAQTMPFTDVRAEDYFYDAVSWAVDEAVTEGMTKTTFGPAVNCTRAHIVTFLWRMAGRPAPAQEDTAFVDVEDNAYYTTAVAWAVEQGITEGVDETHFNPEQECTRKEVAVFLWRFLGEEVPEAEESPFEDVKMTDWYGQAVTWAAEKEITNGRGNNRFETDDVCDRGQAVTFLYRVMKLLDRTDVPEPTEPTDSTEPSQSSGMKLEEDASTVTSGDMLRASTYALTNGTSAQANETTTLKYFNVTLFDYDTDTINNATHKADMDTDANAEKWNGIYFSNGSPEASSYTYTTEARAHTDLTWQQVKNGTYYFDESCTVEATVTEVFGNGGSEYQKVTVTCGELVGSANSTWKRCEGYYCFYNNGYYPLYVYRMTYDGSQYYYWGYKAEESTSTPSIIKSGTNTESGTPPIDVYTKAAATDYILNRGNQEYKRLGGTDLNQKVNVTLYTSGGTNTVTKSYAKYNWWNKTGTAGGEYDPLGQKFYTGLVADELDISGNIVFNEPEGGIFNSDTSVKTIYNNVEMPFVYEDGYYTFDAAVNGVYFHEDATQNSTEKDADDKLRLYFDQKNPQPLSGGTRDNSNTIWLPFNDTKDTPNGEKVYHFGMKAAIDFSMTSNGRIKESDDTSDPIKFSFSGDDDVWVFVDGHLVIDLGGIHNRLDAEIDFEANTVTYSANNGATSKGDTIGSANDTSFELQQKLFGNLIPQDRDTFAASGNHVLTVFYLERGQGTSNCKITFNLPMKDNLTVTKVANQYWSEEKQEATSLSEEHQTAVNNIPFGFTLYRKNKNEETFHVVANTPYLLMENGAVIGNVSTNDKGHFYLKNGQSAKFIGEFEGQIYYVVEDPVDEKGFYTPDYTYTGTAVDGFDWREDSADEWNHVVDAGLIAKQVIPTLEAGGTENNKSYELLVKGSNESSDNLNIICTNYLKFEMPKISINANDVKLVIDYGLPVNIPDATQNDIVSTGNIKKLVGISGPGMKIGGTPDENGLYTTEPTVDDSAAAALKFGTAKLNDDGSITYTLNKQMTDVEVIDYLVYASDAVTTGDTTTTKYAAAIAKIYIIPATTMYYEENFGNLVIFGTKGSDWGSVGTADSGFQETGIVGTISDSPYGSDVAYLNDSGDSNGTSMYVDTENGAASFSYKFTGTGTSFFARTTNNSGYLRVIVKKDGETDPIKSIYRDTVYVTDNNNAVLYNIPVFTLEELEYGTYTVEVAIAKKTMKGETVLFHSEFWLDGIRVVNPMNTNDETNPNSAIALAAYNQDGESNMKSITLRTKLLDTVDEDGNLVWDEEHFVVFTDTNGEIKDAETYESIGPKEEVYLNEGQRVYFSIVADDPNSFRLFMGMKAPMGTAKVTVTTKEFELSNAADCYYDVTDAATKVKQDDGTWIITYQFTSTKNIVSLTNIKVTGDYKFTLVDQRDEFINDDEGDGDSVEP